MEKMCLHLMRNYRNVEANFLLNFFFFSFFFFFISDLVAMEMNEACNFSVCSIYVSL